MAGDDEEDVPATSVENSQSGVVASDETPSESGITGKSVTGADTETQDQTETEPEEHTEASEYEKVTLQMSEDAISLQKELSAIKVVAPDISVPADTDFNREEFPESYRENSPKEKLALSYADNFRRQYVHLYGDRKALLLNPVNECGTEKFVCTTVRPTQLPYKELFNWDGAAEFVADYLNFVSLDPPHDLPGRLLSPTTVLERQKGNCFEYSNLLCSLLIAAGYDCYVVSGYATRETCMMDETRDLCPLLKKSDMVVTKADSPQNKKYAVKPPKDLSSKFIKKMENRKLKELEDGEQKKLDEEETRQLEREKPPPDPLYGLRVHSWVLVLSGKREVPESFFIEPFTGFAHPVDSGSYLGIESVWNHQNYWVNMQDCSQGVTQLQYDLGDCTLWEYMFPSNEKPILEVPEVDHQFEDEEEEEEVEKHLDVPPSWVRQIELTLKNFQMRCPMGKKTKIYKRAKLEKFAHYLMKDGLVTRLSMYQDAEMCILTQVKEFFDHRKDKLIERHHNHINGWITEYYIPGRSCHLKEHEYKASAPGIENDRTMIFFNEARVDGLVKRVETPLSMTEYFIDRPDFLHYRHVEFGRREKKFGPAESAIPRPIERMVERFHRNRDKNANDDVAEVMFIISEERIQLIYHKEDDKISASTQEFIKPANANEKGAYILWHPDTHTTYQVDPKNYEKKKVILYEMLVELIQMEDRCKERVRESEQEVQRILSDRTREEINSDLTISVYDTERNEKAKQRRKELEEEEIQERLRRQVMELDYLAPFLAQIGDPDKIARSQAFRLKEDCLADLKHRLIDKANLIQARFEKETQELQKKQSWYQQHQISMQKDDEDEYLNYCSEAMFRIHILELRLNRHKEMAPQKYMELEQRIRNDPRLSEYF